ncbi:MAG: Ldh family oxidoreductase [Hyphomicrobiaceae bacterium]
MDLDLGDARELVSTTLARIGVPLLHAEIVANHLVYAASVGHTFAGLPRVLALADVIKKRGPGGEIRTIQETRMSAVIEGADVNGYVTSLMGMDKAIELAEKEGVGIVGVRNSWYSGLLAYYVERAAHRGLVGFHAANSTARVAPHGGADAIFGTNPMAWGFPADGEPLVVDFSSAKIAWGDVLYHHKRGKTLEEGVAVDPDGNPTVDPLQALAGAILPWGGARGLGVATIVQALGILAGSPPVMRETGGWGYFFLAFNPDLLMPRYEFKRRVAELRLTVESSRPMVGGEEVRMPGSGSRRRLKETLARGYITIDDEIVEAIRNV